MTQVVIGAGMVGCATALALIKRGYDVVIYEKRPDPRVEENKDVGRSINLAISARGLRSLRAIDPEICDVVISHTVPMKGRMIHAPGDGHMTPILYGVYGTESINSISRSKLNNLMIDAAERAGAKIVFSHQIPSDLEGVSALGETIFGCDGAFSKIRGLIERHTDYKIEQETVSTYYMEVPIPNSEAIKDWPLNYLHIWPRGSHMFIALPNDDGSFTGTLFAPNTLFESDLANPELLAKWFTTEFPDAAKVIGTEGLTMLGKNAPRGKLTSIKFSPYNLGSKIVLLGDASHSMVPFYGQGLNAGLEDVRTLFEQFIDTSIKDEWALAFNAYSKFRKPDLDAINDLSMANYLEMCSSVTKTSFKMRKYFDNMLSKALGDIWLPLYTMVSFRDDVRYSEALTRSKKQDRMLSNAINIIGGAVSIGASVGVLTLLKKYYGTK
ncbi:kynurenine 3-monooxygenase [Starmerella bacillaris]|uniref:Kynurenine 3-monooxygenase n=1 Tax=Starmerella bacillaris TaxID=1247836 RepID=A0AAV5RH47_STABA|nr:kynurenine 3-monooxygenase [Starmerella bacillaris]